MNNDLSRIRLLLVVPLDVLIHLRREVQILVHVASIRIVRRVDLKILLLLELHDLLALRRTVPARRIPARGVAGAAGIRRAHVAAVAAILAAARAALAGRAAHFGPLGLVDGTPLPDLTTPFDRLRGSPARLLIFRRRQTGNLAL